MIGDTAFRPYAVNTFSGNGKRFTTLTPAHYVTPHSVRPYQRKDGTYVSGFWRDGDGNTDIDRSTGYFVRNPNAVPIIIKKGKRL